VNERPDPDPDPIIDIPPKPRPGQKPPGNGGGRPEIEVRVGEMQRAVDEAEAALIAAQASLPVEKKVFRRGDRIVALAIDKTPTTRARSPRLRSSSRWASTPSPSA
jgi:hypothetical protein